LPSITNSPPRPHALPALLPTGIEDASANTEESHQAGRDRRAKLFGELHLELLEEYGPPSVVVNEKHDIVHLSAKAGRYLQFVAGEPTANVLKVVHPALRGELRTSLFRAGQIQDTVFTGPDKIDLAGKQESVSVEVRPMRSTDDAKGFFLILFHKQDNAVAARTEPRADERVNRSLDDEVEFLKEQLDATVEQLRRGQRRVESLQ